MVLLAISLLELRCLSRTGGSGCCLKHVSTPNGEKAPDLRKHCARGGTQTAFPPPQTLDSRGNIRNPGESGPGTTQSETQSVYFVHTSILHSDDTLARHESPLLSPGRNMTFGHESVIHRHRRLSPSI